jgi:hypothetical protein
MPGSGTNVSFSVAKDALRRWLRGPSMLTFEGDTSVTVPPPFAVRSNEPIATTSGSGAPKLVRLANASVPGVHA